MGRRETNLLGAVSWWGCVGQNQCPPVCCETLGREASPQASMKSAKRKLKRLYGLKHGVVNQLALTAGVPPAKQSSVRPIRYPTAFWVLKGYASMTSLLVWSLAWNICSTTLFRTAHLPHSNQCFTTNSKEPTSFLALSKLNHAPVKFQTWLSKGF